MLHNLHSFSGPDKFPKRLVIFPRQDIEQNLGSANTCLYFYIGPSYKMCNYIFWICFFRLIYCSWRYICWSLPDTSACVPFLSMNILVLSLCQHTYWSYPSVSTNIGSIPLSANISVLSLCHHKCWFYPFFSTNICSVPLSAQILVLFLCQHIYLCCPFVSTNINSFPWLAQHWFYPIVSKHIGYIPLAAKVLALFICQHKYAINICTNIGPSLC